MSKEVKFTRASSPGRVCLAGESLDWMINGPSVVGAIDLRVHATVSDRPNGSNGEIILRSAEPIKSEMLIPLNQIGHYDKHPLDFMHAAVRILLDTGLPPHALQIESTTELPAQAGVSSSAAISIATIAAISQHYGISRMPVEVCELAYKVEKIELKTGAGQMDFYACGLGKLHYLNCHTEPPSPLERYSIPRGVRLLLVDTLTSHVTSNFIATKKERFERGEPLIMAYVDKAQAAVEKIRSLMTSFEVNIEEIGHIITLCHGYLRDNVRSSTELLDKCVEICVSNGAYGGKLTGSGMGGCMFALVKEADIERISRALVNLPVKVYSTGFSEDGVRIEEHMIDVK